MEITKKGRFIADFYGGKPYMQGDEMVKSWLENMTNKLLHPRFRMLKEAMASEKKLEEILSIFNVNGEGEPVIGSWMLKSCSRRAHKLAGGWNKFQVSLEMWNSNIDFSPEKVNLYRNGKKILKPEGVEVYAVSLKDGRSFFKAYQLIKAGAEFECKIDYCEDLCMEPQGSGKSKIFVENSDKTQKCVENTLNKMRQIGAYPDRFGFFQWI